MESFLSIPQGEFMMPMRVTEPDFGPAARCILGVHGFCGHKASDNLTFLSEEMSLFGSAMVCFDLPCHGESPMTDGELSLESCQESLLMAALWAQEKYPELPKCIFATGMGAFLTVLCQDELRQILGDVRLVLQSPDFRMSQSLLNLKYLTEEEFRRMGRVVCGRPSDRKMDIPFSFYEQLKNAVVYADYDVPMLLIHGELDEAIPLTDVANFHRINAQAELVIIPGADHQFRGEGQWDMVVDLTRDWFEFQQVTLCDTE